KDGYVFPQRTGGNVTAFSQKGTATFGGAVQFSGHGGVLDLTFANPTIKFEHSKPSTLVVDVDGKATELATLNATQAKRTVLADGTFTWSGVKPELTASGAKAFQGFYDKGTILDKLTFTVGKAEVDGAT